MNGKPSGFIQRTDGEKDDMNSVDAIDEGVPWGLATRCRCPSATMHLIFESFRFSLTWRMWWTENSWRHQYPVEMKSQADGQPASVHVSTEPEVIPVASAMTSSSSTLLRDCSSEVVLWVWHFFFFVTLIIMVNIVISICVCFCMCIHMYNIYIYIRRSLPASRWLSAAPPASPA